MLTRRRLLAGSIAAVAARAAQAQPSKTVRLGVLVFGTPETDEARPDHRRRR